MRSAKGIHGMVPPSAPTVRCSKRTIPQGLRLEEVSIWADDTSITKLSLRTSDDDVLSFGDSRGNKSSGPISFHQGEFFGFIS